VSRGRVESARGPLCEVVPEAQTAEVASPEYVGAEAQGKGKQGERMEAKDEGELADENLDDAALIEASDDKDSEVTEIIGT